jgi:flagellar protein FliT
MSSDQLAPILLVYQEIADTTSAMLEAARSGDWPVVLELGASYCESVEKLRDLDYSAPLDSSSRAIKHDLLVSIIENDADTRDLAMPQMASLGELLGRLKREQPRLTSMGAKAGDNT